MSTEHVYKLWLRYSTRSVSGEGAMTFTLVNLPGKVHQRKRLDDIVAALREQGFTVSDPDPLPGATQGDRSC